MVCLYVITNAPHVYNPYLHVYMNTHTQVVPKTYPLPVNWTNPDIDQTTGDSPTGPTGTYNFLVDAVTDVPATRAM